MMLAYPNLRDDGSTPDNRGQRVENDQLHPRLTAGLSTIAHLKQVKQSLPLVPVLDSPSDHQL
jgi:hypothetical protein